MEKIYRFKNGLRLVVNTLNDYPSVVFSVTVNAGSIYENSENNGVSHFLEHMMFKSTKYHSATELAAAFENIGAVTNAYTSKDETCFYFKSVYTEVENGCKLFSEMIFDRLLLKEEFETEKKVILEEINMNNDEPDTLAMEKSFESYYEGKPLSFSILGSKKSVKNMTIQHLKDYMQEHYTTGNIVISFTGKISFEKAKDLVEKYFNRFSQSDFEKNKCKIGSELSKPKIEYVDKSVEQVNVAITFKGYNYFNKKKYALSILSFIFGGGMSSRLFVKIREKEGLVYSIYSFLDCYLYTGNLIVFFASNYSKYNKTIKLLCEEISDLKRNGITQEELEKAKSFIINTKILSRENLSVISKTSAKQVLFANKTVSVKEFIKNIQAVTLEDVNEVAEDVLSSSPVVAVVGKKVDLSSFQWFFKNNL